MHDTYTAHILFGAGYYEISIRTHYVMNDNEVFVEVQLCETRHAPKFT